MVIPKEFAFESTKYSSQVQGTYGKRAKRTKGMSLPERKDECGT
jgi:hypothetical protein